MSADCVSVPAGFKVGDPVEYRIGGGYGKGRVAAVHNDRVEVRTANGYVISRRAASLRRGSE